jgi:GNAT superfamily N-acetyltransferase
MTLLLGADPGSAVAPHALRRPTPADRSAIEAMYARCSLDTRYRRFHGAVPFLPATYLDACTAGNPAEHDALIATAAGQVVGLASAAPNGEPGTIEVGALVEDTWQRQGVGRDLLAALLLNAASRAVRQVRFEVLFENGWLAAALARTLDVVHLDNDGTELSLLCRIPRAA